MSYDSLLSKIPGGDENTFKNFLQCQAFLGGKKRRVNETFFTFVFKQERQDVGVTLIHLNSSIHPQVLTCKFCSAECETKIRSLMSCLWTVHGAKCFRPHLGQTGECQMNVDMWWDNGCCVENGTKSWKHNSIPKSLKAKIFFFLRVRQKTKLRSNFTSQEICEGKDGTKESISTFTCLQRILICKTIACWKVFLDIKFATPHLETFWVKEILLANQKGWRNWKIKKQGILWLFARLKEHTCKGAYKVWEMQWDFPIRSEKNLREVIKVIYFEVLLAISPQYCTLYLDTVNLSVCLELATCSRSFRHIRNKTGKEIMQEKYTLKELQNINTRMPPPYFRTPFGNFGA